MVGRACRKAREERTYANDALGTNELDKLICHAALRVALPVRLKVAQVTDVAVLVGGSAVLLAVRVDCAIHELHHLSSPIPHPPILHSLNSEVRLEWWMMAEGMRTVDPGGN